MLASLVYFKNSDIENNDESPRDQQSNVSFPFQANLPAVEWIYTGYTQKVVNKEWLWWDIKFYELRM